MIGLGHLILSIFALAPLSKHYSKKPVSRWSRKRLVYFSCYISIIIINLAFGIMIFINNAETKYYHQIAMGLSCFPFAIAPCGIKFVNDHWYIKWLRDSFAIAVGISYLTSAWNM